MSQMVAVGKLSGLPEHGRAIYGHRDLGHIGVRTVLTGLHLGYLVDYLHPVYHFTKDGIAPTLCSLAGMVEKGIVAKSRLRPAKYRAAISPDEVSTPFLDLLVEEVSGPVPLMAHLVRDESLTREDLDEMQRLIDAARRNLKDRRRPEK